MKLDGETGGQLLVTTILIFVVVAVIFRVRAIRSVVIGATASTALGA